MSLSKPVGYVTCKPVSFVSSKLLPGVSAVSLKALQAVSLGKPVGCVTWLCHSVRLVGCVTLVNGLASAVDLSKTEWPSSSDQCSPSKWLVHVAAAATAAAGPPQRTVIENIQRKARGLDADLRSCYTERACRVGPPSSAPSSTLQATSYKLQATPIVRREMKYPLALMG
ncbi:hypothetical protein RRG08_014155 [Elysia crispata]|uniref:Uncharacterized protein n=1 Tax=Elysia crispata TaxID=231223 RepID=A0AAE1A3V1_9GAST|nr:hypothetical protein RRG08_014155 [Elysia crispata]